MGVNSLPKTVTRQRRGCDLNPGPSAPESSTLTTRLPSHPLVKAVVYYAFANASVRAVNLLIYSRIPGTSVAKHSLVCLLRSRILPPPHTHTFNGPFPGLPG